MTEEDQIPEDSGHCKSSFEIMAWAIRKVGKKYSDRGMIDAANELEKAVKDRMDAEAKETGKGG